jgi:hypothetical protein
VLAALLPACEPPAASAPAGAAVVALPPSDEPLPPQVEATVRQLMQIAETGSYRDMARLAGQTPDFRSNTAGMSHSEYWYLKLRAGDWPMAQMQKVLRYRPAILEDADARRIYVWPWMATLSPAEITPAVEREIDAMLGEGQGAAMRAGGLWQGYLLGVSEEGEWLYFVSGAG